MKLVCKQSALPILLLGVVGVAQASNLSLSAPALNVDMVATSFGGTMPDWATTQIGISSYGATARTAIYNSGRGLDSHGQFSNNVSYRSDVGRLAGFGSSSPGASAVGVSQAAFAFDRLTAVTEMPNYGDRTKLGVMDLNFVPISASKVDPESTSFVQIIRTNATAEGFVSAASESQSYAMMLAGMGMIGTIIRRRRGGTG